MIVTVAGERPIGPGRFIEEAIGIDTARKPENRRRAVSAASFRFLVLPEAGCLICVSGAKRRGSIEHLYRASEPHFIDQEWAEVPAAERDPIRILTWRGPIARTEAARLAWTAARLDQCGREEVTSIIAEASGRLERTRLQAENRRAENETEGGIRTTFALVSFEFPDTFFCDDGPFFTLPESRRREESLESRSRR